MILRANNHNILSCYQSHHFCLPTGAHCQKLLLPYPQSKCQFKQANNPSPTPSKSVGYLPVLWVDYHPENQYPTVQSLGQLWKPGWIIFFYGWNSCQKSSLLWRNPNSRTFWKESIFMFELDVAKTFFIFQIVSLDCLLLFSMGSKNCIVSQCLCNETSSAGADL